MHEAGSKSAAWGTRAGRGGGRAAAAADPTPCTLILEIHELG